MSDPSKKHTDEAAADAARKELEELRKQVKDQRLMTLIAEKRREIDVQQLSEQFELRTEHMEAERVRLRQAVQLAQLKAENDALKRAIAEQVPSATTAQQTVPQPVKSSERHRLSEVLPVWQRLRNNAKATVIVYSDAVKRFEAHYPDLSVESIERQHVDSYIDALQDAGLHAKTIEKEHGALRALLNVAIRKLRWIESNPASGTELPSARGASGKRRSYTIDELRKIFSAPVFTGGERPARGKGEAGFWIPLLMLYTGARREEIAQLVVDRVKEIDGVHYVAIDPIDDDGRLKTDESRRSIPIHPALIRIGFLEFVKSRIRQGGGQLFPLLVANERGQYAAKWGDWWGRYVREVVGIKDKRIGPSHSFRHGFIDECRRLEFREDFERALVGHVRGGGRKDAHDNYGEHSVAALFGPLQRIDFRGLDLTNVTWTDVGS